MSKCYASDDRGITKDRLAEIGRQYGEMVAVSVVSGNKQRALLAVEQAFETLDYESKNKRTLESHIDDVLPTKLVTILNAHGIKLIGDLVLMTTEEVADVKNFDWIQAAVVNEHLESYGFALAKSC